MEVVAPLVLEDIVADAADDIRSFLALLAEDARFFSTELNSIKNEWWYVVKTSLILPISRKMEATSASSTPSSFVSNDSSIKSRDFSLMRISFSRFNSSREVMAVVGRVIDAYDSGSTIVVARARKDRLACDAYCRVCLEKPGI